METSVSLTSLNGICRNRRTARRNLPSSCVRSLDWEASSWPRSLTVSEVSLAGINGRMLSGKLNLWLFTFKLSFRSFIKTAKLPVCGFKAYSLFKWQCSAFFKFLISTMRLFVIGSFFKVKIHYRLLKWRCGTQVKLINGVRSLKLLLMQRWRRRLEIRIETRGRFRIINVTFIV